MKPSLDQNCLGHYDLAAYVSGAVYADNKRRIEHHLSACHSCFEIFIDAFNQCLGQRDFSNLKKHSAQAGLRPAKIP